MISKLVSEMPGGFHAMNAYLKRNIADALRSMQVGGSVRELRRFDACLVSHGNL